MRLNRISIYASVALVSAALITGCGGGSSLSSALSSLSGNASDGYLNGATVEFDGEQTTSSSTGAYSFSFSSTPTATNLKVSGGIDISTGETFEGELSTYVSSGSTSANVTPLTSIVAAAMESNSSAVLSDVETTVAAALSIDVSMLQPATDPIAKLTSGTTTEKNQAAAAIKQALVIQKVIESFSKAASGTESASAVQTNSALIYTQVATNLSSSSADLDTALND